jgi:hypothetical protein
MFRAVLLASVIAATIATSPTHAGPAVCHAVDVELQPEMRTDIRPG